VSADSICKAIHRSLDSSPICETRVNLRTEEFCSHFLGVSRDDDSEQQHIILSEACKRAGIEVGNFTGKELRIAIEQVPGVLIVEDEIEQNHRFVFWV
jgi:hypothetical protein